MWRNDKISKSGERTPRASYRDPAGRIVTVSRLSDVQADTLVNLSTGLYTLPAAEVLDRHGLGHLVGAYPHLLPDGAERLARDAVAELPVRGMPTLCDAVDEAIEYSRGNADTRAKYRRMIELYVRPYFADTLVGAPTRATFRDWQAWMLGDDSVVPDAPGVSGVTVGRVRGSILQRTFTRAQQRGDNGEDRWRDDNPLDGLPIPPAEQVFRPNPLRDPAEVAALIRAAYDVDPLGGDMTMCLLGTGMRWGELAGALANAVLAADAVVVAGASVLLQPAGRPPVLRYNRAKTEESTGRELAYPAQVASVLVPRAAAAASDPREPLLFRPAGRPRDGVMMMHHSNWSTRSFQPAVARAQERYGLRPGRFRPHDLRHSLLNWLGHDDRVTRGDLKDFAGHTANKDITDHYVGASRRTRAKVRASIAEFMEAVPAR